RTLVVALLPYTTLFRSWSVAFGEVDGGAAAMAVAATHGVGGGLNAMGHLLRALHAFRPGRRPVAGGRRSSGRCGLRGGGRRSTGCAGGDLRRGLATGLIALLQAVGGTTGCALQR